MERVGQLIPLVLAALIAQIFAANIGAIVLEGRLFLLVALAVCGFFAASYAMGTGLARVFRLSYPQRALLAMTTTARNAPLLLALTAAAIPDQPLILAAIVFGMLIEIPQLTLLKELLLRQRRGVPSPKPVERVSG